MKDFKISDKNFLQNSICFQNRELSWLKFNERVLDEAMCKTVPLFERLKFVSIFSSNLDEFFMVRIAKFLNFLSCDFKNKKNLKKFLEIVFNLVRILLKKQSKIFKKLEKSLSLSNIDNLKLEHLNFVQKLILKNLAVNLKRVVLKKNSNFYDFKSERCYFVLELKNKFNGETKIWVYFSNDSNFKVLVFLNNKKMSYILTENLLLKFLPYDKKNYKLISRFKFKIVRSVELNNSKKMLIQKLNKFDYVKYYLDQIEKSAVVAFFYNGKPTEKVLKFFQNSFKLRKFQMFKIKVPILMDYVFYLQKFLLKKQKFKLCYRSFRKINKVEKNKILNNQVNVYKKILVSDLLLFFPYEPVEEFLNFLKEAALDENVTVIKITLYRVAVNSVLVEILKMAAKKKKNVVVFIELFARFDEKNNLEISRELKSVGCKVFFGFKNFKIHSKICVVIKKTITGKIILTQIGTGNYNEKTAHQYSDLSFFTSNEKIGIDALKFFDCIETLNLNVNYSTLIVAPKNLKQRILELIVEEQKKGKYGRIFMKMNALTDFDVMNKLIEASKSGVKIVLNVRGICCLLPEIKNFTENIKIFSVVGRFLEHARIYCFGSRLKTMKIFIGSADMMKRNMKNRFEILVPVFSSELKIKILKIIKILNNDNIKSRHLTKQGKLKANKFKLKKIDSQNMFGELAGNFEKIK